MRTCFAVVLCMILAGCGKKTPPEREVPVTAAPDTAQPVVESTAPIPESFDEGPAEKKEPVSEFDRRMQEIDALVQKTDFAGALRLCRTTQRDPKFKDRRKELHEKMQFLVEGRRAAGQLSFAVENLASDDQGLVRESKSKLSDAGEPGRVFLRNALRTRDGAVAREAGLYLAELNDVPSIPILLERLKADPASPIGRAATKAFSNMAEDLDERTVSTCFEMVAKDRDFRVTHVVDVLETVFRRVCNKDETAFNDMLGHPEGMEILRAHMADGLQSGDAGVVKWACGQMRETLPLLSGFCARYYPNTEFKDCVLSRPEPRVAVGNRAFPFPDKRQDDISARWTGDLLVHRAGKYSFTLAYNHGAPQSARLWVDNVPLLAPTWPPSATAKTDLTAGWHSIRVDYVKRKGGNDQGGVDLSWSGPNGKGPAAELGTRPWPEWIAALSKAVSDLSSKDGAAVRAARARLASAQNTGIVFLLGAVKRDRSEGGRQAMDALCMLTPQVEARLFPGIHQAALKDGAGVMNRYFSILCAALCRRCDSDPAKFGELVGDPEGYSKLRTHVKAALISKDGAAVARACRNGYPFAPLMPGLNGRYYGDPNFGKLLLERVDDRIHVENHRFPLAANRQHNISAEWNGWLSVATAGEYTFHHTADSYAGVYVDGEHVNAGNWQAANRRKLERGLHQFKVVFVKNAPHGNSHVSVQWEGPGLGRQPISGVFRCEPWDDKLAEIGKAISRLGSGKKSEAAWARQVLAAAGEVGRVYLRNAARHAPDAAAGPAALALGGSGDSDAVPLLLARLKTAESPDLVTALAESLGMLTRSIDARVFPVLYRAAMARKASGTNPYATILCAALWQVCDNDPKQFGKLVDDVNAHTKLTKHAGASFKWTAIQPGLHVWCLHEVIDNDDPAAYDPAKAKEKVKAETFDWRVGKRNETISLRFEGVIKIPTDGRYKFYTTSDDCSRLYLNGKMVVNNGGTHGMEEKSGVVDLKAGLAPVVVTFSQGGGGVGLKVEWEGPEIPRAEIPKGVLFRRLR